jgi:hypothetical protein
MVSFVKVLLWVDNADASRWAPLVRVLFVLVVEDEVGRRYLVWEPSRRVW